MDAHAGLPHLQPILLFLAIAGLVMPLLARARVSQVVAFLVIGALVGPNGLGRIAADHAWLRWLTIADGEGVRVLAQVPAVWQGQLLLPALVRGPRRINRKSKLARLFEYVLYVECSACSVQNGVL